MPNPDVPMPEAMRTFVEDLFNSTAESVLELAAKLFENSPRTTFTREEIVSWLRALPDEIRHAGRQAKTSSQRQN